MRALNVHSKVISLSVISSLAGLGSKYAGLESEPQLSDLMNEVASKVYSKWKEVSIQLGLTLNDQKYFMELTLGDPKHCFTFVFTVWKSRVTRRVDFALLRLGRSVCMLDVCGHAQQYI